MHTIGYILKKKGRYNEALKWLRRALEGQEKSLEYNHEDTRNTTNSIGLALWNQCHYDEALKSFMKT